MAFLWVFKSQWNLPIRPLLPYFAMQTASAQCLSGEPRAGIATFYENRITVKCFARGPRVDANTDIPTPLPQHAPSACLQRHAGNLRMLILDLKSKINVKLNKLPFKRNLLQAFRGAAR